MSLLTKSVLAVAAVLIAAYVAGQLTSKSIHTEVEVKAPPAAVWDVLTKIEDYPNWNPFIRRVTGNLAVGGTLAITLHLGEKSPQTFTPTVLVLSENQELRWIGKAGVSGIFDGEHRFVLEETPQGTTMLRHSEEFSGMLAHPLLFFIGADTKAGFIAMNKALKEKVEKAH